MCGAPQRDTAAGLPFQRTKLLDSSDTPGGSRCKGADAADQAAGNFDAQSTRRSRMITSAAAKTAVPPIGARPRCYALTGAPVRTAPLRAPALPLRAMTIDKTK